MTRGLWAFFIISQIGAKEISYNWEVRPILSDNCFLCHGPDEASNKAGLRLDRAEDALGAVTDGGRAVLLPGDPEKSELWNRIVSVDQDEVMPPPESHLSLTADEKAIIYRWIQEGAKYEKHWAFLPLRSEVPVPEVADGGWPLDPLDHFVLARLEEEKINPSPEADPLRWLRRVSLDLTGLPPTPEAIARFQAGLADDPEAARGAAVDELLASSAYGEHLAVGWLDAARYADSYGYQSDQLNGQWPYRDWVIEAFNKNLPYDEFATWQVAGDLLPEATNEQRLATAFQRLHRLTNEGGSIRKEWMTENAADRVHTFGTTFLGMTFECSKCHDHKYDPIPTRDYYALMGFFNSIDESGLYDHTAKVPSPTLLLPKADQQKALEGARENLAKAEADYQAVQGAADERFEAWLVAKDEKLIMPDLEGRFDFDGIEGRAVPNVAEGGEGQGQIGAVKVEDRGEGKALVFDGDSGAVFANFFQVDRWTPFTLGMSIFDTERSEQAVVVAQKSFGTDVGYNGFDVMLEGGFLEARMYRIWPGNGIGVRTKEPISKDQWTHLTVTYDGSSRADGLVVLLNGKRVETEVLRDSMVKRVMLNTYGSGHFTLAERFRDRGFVGGKIDDLVMYRRALSELEVRELYAPGEGREATREQWREYFGSAIDEGTREAAGRLMEARRALVAAEDAIAEIPVMEEMPKPRETHVLARGEYDAPTDESTLVERASPTALPPMTARGEIPDRLDLANWLTDPDHPLTSRIFVNRLWGNFFGKALVDTPENFGLQGSLPSHPDLLDWLAREFVKEGWDIKKLCRRIVLSRTYRQDSRTRSELQERDPENDLLARGPAHRLAAEQIRDLALASSGLLDTTAGGPPVAPYQPGGDLWRESNGMSPAYRQSTGQALYRRSIYSVWKRTAPLPNMVAFDAGSREVCAVARGRTNTPLQALVLLNDVQFVEAARHLAQTVFQADSVAEEIKRAFLRVTGRHASSEEIAILEKLHASEMSRFAGEPEAAKQVIAHGESKADPSLPVDHLAATTSVCLAILNLDSAIWKR